MTRMSVGDSVPAGGSGRTPHILLAFLLLLMALQPIATVAGGLLVRLAFAAILLASIEVVSSRRGFFVIGLLLGIPALGLLFVPGRIPIVLGGVLAIATLVFICYVLLSRIFNHPAVTAATISTSLVVYLMLGVIWAQAYRLVEHLRPGSFTGISTESLAEVQRELFYFSYVTLTTLGFGDISPAGAEARSLVITEAIVGQIYLVVLVAGVVGMLLAQKQAKSDG